MTWDPADAGPLSGVRIVDFTRVLAGPYATMLLADLGADVVKVERAGAGDDTRNWGPHWADGISSYFQSVNRNKTSFACDFDDRAQLDAVRDLCLRADVLVENFRSGTMSRHGLGPEQLRALRPELVYCSLTGFGSGAGAALSGYDSIVQALSGLMSVTGDAEADPMKVGVAVIDIIAGLHITLGVLAALRHRDHGGTGQHVEINLMSSALSAMTYHATAVLNGGAVPGRIGNRHPSIAPSEVFDAVGGSVMLAVGTDRQFRALCDVLGRADLQQDPRFGSNAQRLEHGQALGAELALTLRERDAAELVKSLAAAGVPSSLVHDVRQALTFAEDLDLEPAVAMTREDGTISRQVRHPISFSATPATYRRAPARWSDVNSIKTWKKEKCTWLS